ncbi:MAG: hypothetical protein M3Q33_14945 [Acidobacteriota bacterium]|nr:hypothetical protein [Acidobacteriota bacterium]
MEKEKSPLPSTNLGAVIGVLEDMQTGEIISNYAVGGAVAAILHSEPISTVDLDIFFFLAEPPTGLILSLEKIYDYARKNNFPFDKDFINIQGWLVQFVEASHSPLWTEAVETAETMTIDDRAARVIDREHLAAVWIYAGRKKDIRKIEMFDEAGIMDAKILYDVLLRFNLLDRWRLQQHNFSDEYQF